MDNKEFHLLVLSALNGNEQDQAYLTYVDNIEHTKFRRQFGLEVDMPESEQQKQARETERKAQQLKKDMRNEAGKRGIKGGKK